MLGAPLGTIKGRMRLGLEKIRVTLAEALGEEEEDVPEAYL
jgi:DNA-directed RNA polymerase specialized sigma24 family protein